MDSSNEITELKNFMLSLRSGNLLKLIESNQSHIQEKYNSMCIKVKQSEEELTKQRLILQQNSHLIERFQNQLQELSNQNSELLEKQQSLKEENENLKNQLQCSEDKFAQLDIVYDQQVTNLSEKVQELEEKIEELKTIQSQGINQLDQTQTELNDKLGRSEEMKADLERKLKELTEEREGDKKQMQQEIDKLNELNESLTSKVSKYEEDIKEMQKDLLEALNDKKQVDELKNKIEDVQGAREADANEFHNEKCRLVAINNDLKSIVEDLKKKLATKDREAEDAYIKCKQLSKVVAAKPIRTSPLKSKYLSRKRSSSDDPKPLDNTSDSDESSVSFYHLRHKARKISEEMDNENLFDTFSPNLEKKSKSSGLLKKMNPTVMVSRNSSAYQHLGVAENPVVTSSAFARLEKK